MTSRSPSSAHKDPQSESTHACANREAGVFPPIRPKNYKIRLRLRRGIHTDGCMYTHTCDEPKNDVTVTISVLRHAQKAKMAQRAFLFSLLYCFEEKKTHGWRV